MTERSYHTEEYCEYAPEFERDEIVASFLRPGRMINIILAERKRWASTIATQDHLGPLALLMFTASLVFAIPFGLVVEVSSFWRVPVAFLGSLLICFPSLQVFTAFIGFRVDVKQNLSLALLITSVTGIFTFGFAPILLFLSWTLSDKSQGTIEGLTILFLVVSLLSAIIHLSRVLFGDRRLAPGGAYSALFLLWQMLLIFITVRMCLFLKLF